MFLDNMFSIFACIVHIYEEILERKVVDILFSKRDIYIYTDIRQKGLKLVSFSEVFLFIFLGDALVFPVLHYHFKIRPDLWKPWKPSLQRIQS